MMISNFRKASRNDNIGLVSADQHRVDGKKSNFLKLEFWPIKCKSKIIQALASSMLERKVCFSMCYNQSRRLIPSLPKSCTRTVHEHSGRCLPTPVLTIFIHGLPVGCREVGNSSNSFALGWWVVSSEVEKLKWFCFDLALKLALYTSKKTKKAVTLQCVLPTRPSQDGKCHWSVLENWFNWWVWSVPDFGFQNLEGMF